MGARIRNVITGVIAAVSLGAMVVATSTPAAAWGHGRYGGGGWGRGPGIAAGVLGGLALGAIVAGSGRQSYAAPVYGAPVYAPPVAYEDDEDAPVCRHEWRPMYRADGLYLRDRLVRVCN
jgi:hypothetical protein